MLNVKKKINKLTCVNSDCCFCSIQSQKLKTENVLKIENMRKPASTKKYVKLRLLYYWTVKVLKKWMPFDNTLEIKRKHSDIDWKSIWVSRSKGTKNNVSLFRTHKTCNI